MRWVAMVVSPLTALMWDFQDGVEVYTGFDPSVKNLFKLGNACELSWHGSRARCPAPAARRVAPCCCAADGDPMQQR